MAAADHGPSARIWSRVCKDVRQDNCARGHVWRRLGRSKEAFVPAVAMAALIRGGKVLPCPPPPRATLVPGLLGSGRRSHRDR